MQLLSSLLSGKTHSLQVPSILFIRRKRILTIKYSNVACNRKCSIKVASCLNLSLFDISPGIRGFCRFRILVRFGIQGIEGAAGKLISCIAVVLSPGQRKRQSKSGVDLCLPVSAFLQKFTGVCTHTLCWAKMALFHSWVSRRSNHKNSRGVCFSHTKFILYIQSEVKCGVVLVVYLGDARDGPPVQFFWRIGIFAASLSCILDLCFPSLKMIFPVIFMTIFACGEWGIQ